MTLFSFNPSIFFPLILVSSYILNFFKYFLSLFSNEVFRVFFIGKINIKREYKVKPSRFFNYSEIRKSINTLLIEKQSSPFKFLDNQFQDRTLIRSKTTIRSNLPPLDIYHSSKKSNESHNCMFLLWNTVHVSSNYYYEVSSCKKIIVLGSMVWWKYFFTCWKTP